MDKATLESLCKQYRISQENGALEAKRKLFSILIEKHDAEYAPHLLPGIRLKTEPELDALLSRLIAKEEWETKLTPRKNERKPLALTQLCYEMDSVIKANERFRYSPEKAAKVVHSKPSYKAKYKSPGVIANTYRQARIHAAAVQSERDRNVSSLLVTLLAYFSQDAIAMSLWADFCYWLPRLIRALNNGDVHLVLEAGAHVDRVLNCHHPFSVQLALLWAPVSSVWNSTGRFVCDMERDHSNATVDVGDIEAGAPEIAERLETFLRASRVYRPMSKPRSRK